jgi:DNA-binding NarL/FixJ family response regulator
MKVVLVEDHPVVRRGIVQLLQEEPDIRVCGEAEAVDDALETIAREHPDIVVVDLSLRDSSGIELLRLMKQRHPEIRALVLTMHAEADYVEKALRAGARGYVTKDQADERIIDALRKVSAGHLYLDPTTSEAVLLRLVDGPEKSLDEQVNELSQRERSVFLLMGQGKSSRDIANRLGLNVKTVETYRRRIRAKLDVTSMSQLTHTAFEFVQEHKNG